jgi:Protein of unknown function (DUF2851)
MKEDFLHYIWKFKKFDVSALKTVTGEVIELINGGQYLQQSGPDFFNAQLIIGGQRWAGNVEIHIKSSDWYHHSHETDSHYDNVVLHVVWEHDAEVLRKDGTELPVLELRPYVDGMLLANYQRLAAAKTWINCEKELETLNSFVFDNWKERLFFERLERKALPVMQLATDTQSDWEAVLFCFLAKNFGLNTNGEAFFSMTKSLSFGIVRKESFEIENLEALLFGRAGMLGEEFEEIYPADLKMRFEYIAHKYQLQPYIAPPAEYFRHRPDNFPTVRMAQLAALYHTHQNLFSAIMGADSLQAIYTLFNVSVSEYWLRHYRFDKESPTKRKLLSKSFIDLIIINTIVPFKFAYAKSIGKDETETLIALLQQIDAEKNNIVDKFRYYKVPVVSAYDSQSLLQLKNEYCNHKRCMDCSVGLELLKR